MKYFLVSCWSQSAEVIAAIVKIDAQLTRTILKMSTILSSKTSKNAGLHEITAFDKSVVYFPEDMTPSTFANWSGDGDDVVEISKATYDAIRKEIGNSAPRTDEDILHVSDDTFHWTGRTKQSGEEIEVTIIPVSALR